MTNSRPRWVLVTPDYPDTGGGISRLLAAIVANTADSINWRVATTSPGPATDGLRRAGSRQELIAGLRSDIAWARQGSDSRIICGHAYLAGPVLIASRIAGIPTSALVYGREVLPVRAHHRALLAPLAGYSRVVSISEATTARLGGIGVAASAVRTVHPDIATTNLGPEPKPVAPAQGLEIMLLSRLSERYKNVDLVLAALTLLRNTGVVNKCRFVGGGTARVGYEREVARLGLEKTVEFTGGLPDSRVTELFHRSHVGLFPSRDSSAELGFEGFGLVIQEMAAAGLPVLVGDAAGAREAARPGWSRVLDPEDALLWSEVLRELAATGSPLDQMRANARSWATNLDPRIACRETVEALRG